MRIEAIPIFKDNYVWLLHDGQNAIVIDPGDAAPVQQALQEKNLQLREIWVTHHHLDHVAGIPALMKFAPSVVLRAPEGSYLPHVAHYHGDNDQFPLLPMPGSDVTVLFVPGHTADHIAYLINPVEGPGPVLFCGDTLFGAGCGRLLGGTAEQLYTSLKRIAALPDDTRIYCTHEYTESNLRFASQVEPSNPAIQARSERVHLERVKGKATVPLTLAEERMTNPFLRTNIHEVSEAVLKQSHRKALHPAEIFKELRAWKDTF